MSHLNPSVVLSVRQTHPQCPIGPALLAIMSLAMLQDINQDEKTMFGQTKLDNYMKNDLHTLREPTHPPVYIPLTRN